MNIQTMNFKGLEWYIINETEKEKLLFMKDCFTNEMIIKYFDDYYNDFDVQFNPDKTKIWWEDSYINEILNGAFLNFLGKENLNVMKTTLTLGNEIMTTKDYVRLITKEEAEKLPKEILKTIKKYGYWTMSPYRFSGNAYVFYVYGASSPGDLSNYTVNGSRAVRPVISL